MSSNFLRCVAVLLVFSAVAFFANFLIADSVIPLGFIVASHLFFAVVNVLLLYIFDLVTRHSVDKAGFAFIGFVFVKALLIFVFLSIISGYWELTKLLMLSFALSYLAYLFFSIYLCLKTLRFYEK